MPEQTPKSTFELVNDLIVAVSHLLWPIIVIVIAVIYRRQIAGILNRLKKGKFLGQELELEPEIKEFSSQTSKAPENVAVASLNVEDRDSINDNKIDRIIGKSAEDPKIGIILLSREIEKELNLLIASMGLRNELKGKSLRNGFDLLASHNYISEPLHKSVAIFWNLRNKLVHGDVSESDDQLIRVLDIGVQLLEAIKAIPHQKVYVFESDIPIYFDQACNGKIEGVTGVIIEQVSSEDGTVYRSIFPTTLQYEPGQRVSWEWNLHQRWDETWYKDPLTGEVKQAWASSAEFVGKPLKTEE